MQQSLYQEAIYKHFRMAKTRKSNGKRSNLIVSAVAGSGKSTTLRASLQHIVSKNPNDRILVLQFNKHIEQEMIAKITTSSPQLLRNVTIKTTHGAGYQVLRDNNKGGRVESGKYRFLAKDIVKKHGSVFIDLFREDFKTLKQAEQERQCLRKAGDQLTELARYCILNCTIKPSNEEMSLICDAQELEINPGVFPYMHGLLKDAIDSLNKKKGLSFEEMIAGPIITNCIFTTYDWVLVDEVQDLNPAQLELVLRFAGDKGFIAAFGDPRQSIMSFAGAMSDSTKRYKQGTLARKLPLNICYRCDNSILELARLIVPEIESRPECPEGEVSITTKIDIVDQAQPGDAVLCRLTAPLVSMCIDLIKKRKSAYVKGGQLGKKMMDICEVLGTPLPVTDFLNQLTEYEEKQKAKMLKEKRSQRQVDLLVEKCDCIRIIGEFVLMDHKDSGRGVDVHSMINQMFSDEQPKNSITLSTIHRTKGLEFDRVFIIEFDKMPFKPAWKKEGFTPEAYEQEVNLIYVALTRAGHHLFIQGEGIDSMEQVQNKLKTCACMLLSLRNKQKEPALDPDTEITNQD